MQSMLTAVSRYRGSGGPLTAAAVRTICGCPRLRFRVPSCPTAICRGTGRGLFATRSFWSTTMPRRSGGGPVSSGRIPCGL